MTDPVSVSDLLARIDHWLNRWEEGVNSQYSAAFSILEACRVALGAQQAQREIVKDVQAQLGACERIIPDVLDMMRREKFVFNRFPRDMQKEPPVGDGERWEAFAFSIYAELGALSSTVARCADDLEDALNPAVVDGISRAPQPAEEQEHALESTRVGSAPARNLDVDRDSERPEVTPANTGPVAASSFAGVAREVSLLERLEQLAKECDEAERVLREAGSAHLSTHQAGYARLIREAIAEGRALAEARDQLVASADAIRAECLKAGMQEPSTLLDYIRTVFYAYQRDRKNLTAADTALGDAQRQISALRDALGKYARHRPDCFAYLTPEAPCACGLTNLLSGESRP